MTKRRMSSQWRVALLVSAGLGLNVSASAQTPGYDPFSPNTLSPFEPGALPNAPAPVAPKLPPRPPVQPKPVVVQPTPPATPPAPVKAATAPQPVTPATPQKPAAIDTKPSSTSKSFWDELSDLFGSNEPEETKTSATATKTIEPKTTTPTETQPENKSFSDQINTVVKTETPEPQNTIKTQNNGLSLTLTDIPTPTQARPSQNSARVNSDALSLTLPEPAAPTYQAPADPRSTNPFAAQTQAPTSPQALPQAAKVQPAPPPPTPTLKTAPTSTKAPSEVVQTPAPQAIEPAMTAPKINVAQTPPVETAAQKEPGFFDRISNLFSGDSQPESKAIAETAAEPVETVKTIQTLEPDNPVAQYNDVSAEENAFSAHDVAPQTPSAVAEVEPVQTTRSDATPTNVVEEINSLKEPVAEEPGFFDRIANIFDSDDDPRTIEVKQAEPEKATPSRAQQEVAKLENEEPGFFDRVGSFFDDAFYDEPESTKVKPEPKTTPQPVASIPSTQPTKPQPTLSKTQAAVSERALDPRLVKAKLGLGRDIHLGQHGNALSTDAKCFTKNRGTIAFCLTPTRWPNAIARHFEVSSHLYQGPQGIVQLDGDIATRVLALFNTKGTDDIVDYFTKQLGAPTNRFNRTTRTLKMGIVDNPTFVWQKTNPDTGISEILEIRTLADIRGSIPDLQRGVVRSYYGGSREIFSLTSDLDFMDLR